MIRDKKGRVLSPSVASRGQCTIKGLGQRESVVTSLQKGCYGRIPLSLSERGYAEKTETSAKG